ncbi:MAG: UDP-glucose 4-epimerase, partial [Rhodospirillales bacterium]|nr:UDP-glucose 4-epimerase [Rhodospirillales bacterium]
MSKAVLVTGGAGYIGAHVAKALAASGYLPVTIDNFAYGHRAAVRWGPLVEGDIGDGDLVARTLAAHNVVAAVHLAGYAYVGESVTDPLKYFDNNVARSITLLAALRHAGARAVVFSSSCAVYGEPVRVPIDEDHPYAPVNPYGQSKLMFERILEATGRAHGLKWLALRYFNAAGADPDGELGEDHNPETHLIPLAIFAAQGKGPALQVLGTDYDTPDG